MQDGGLSVGLSVCLRLESEVGWERRRRRSGSALGRRGFSWVGFRFKFRQTSACGTSCDIPDRHAFAFGSMWEPWLPSTINLAMGSRNDYVCDGH